MKKRESLDLFKKQIEFVNPEKDILKKIKEISNEVTKEISHKLKKRNILAEVFIGGSVGKNTLIRRDKYDVDIFVRFNDSYDSNKISNILSGILGKEYKRIHGSRDYYQNENGNIIIEIIPVIKIKNPKDADNITDLSYFHVKYVLNKIKNNPKLLNEIKLAKAFSYYQNCYGAESYIKGFSGYAIELLIIHYGSFLKFIKETGKSDNKKRIIIDDERLYKSDIEVMEKLNISKTKSPIILIDPTYQERNALAGLSLETFNKFKNSCRKFLDNPHEKFFIKTKVADSFIKEKNLKVLEIKTTKQKGDIAGTKSKKFFDFFSFILEKDFEIKKRDYDYIEDKNITYYYFIVDKKEDSLLRGPPINAVNNFKNFKKHHKNYFVKNKIAYAKIKHDIKFEDLIKKFIKKNKRILEDMSIKEMKIVKR